MINLDKKNLPSHLYKFNVALVAFFIGWFVAGVPVMVTVGCLNGEKPITYIVMGSVFGLFFIGLLVFVIVDNVFHKRLVAQRTAELREEFRDMYLDEAVRILKERGVITDKGFIVDGNGIFGKEVLPFENTLFSLNYPQLALTVKMDIALYKDNGDYAGVLQLDRALYNFLKNTHTKIKDDRAFSSLVYNKAEFAKYALGQAKIFKLNLTGYRMHG